MSTKNLAYKEPNKFELTNILQMEKISWRKKLRARWIKKGDKSTKYLPCLTNHQKMINYVEEVEIDD